MDSSFVLYENGRRLTLKESPDLNSKIVGILLMKNAREGKGCIFIVDEIKGNRAHVNGIEGPFLDRNGNFMHRRELRNDDEVPTVGWLTINDPLNLEEEWVRWIANV